MHKLLIILCLALILPACKAGTSVKANPSTVKRYALAGKVVSVDKDKKTLKIDHEAIPGYMDAMTMVYPVQASSWDLLNPGADIRADLVVDSSAEPPAWLENIVSLASTDQERPPAPEAEDLPTKESQNKGGALPNFRLTDQDGKRFSLHDYRGKALAITFIYSQCPLPDYCIRMSRNFSDAAIMLNSEPEFKNKIRLLSVSFDPARDTPEKLRSYGQGYLGNDHEPDFTVWQLAVATDAETRKMADFFGLRYFVNPSNQTQFNHTLVTVVVSPKGRILMVNDDNNWNGADLLEQLKSTLK